GEHRVAQLEDLAAGEPALRAAGQHQALAAQRVADRPRQIELAGADAREAGEPRPAPIELAVVPVQHALEQLHDRVGAAGLAVEFGPGPRDHVARVGVEAGADGAPVVVAELQLEAQRVASEADAFEHAATITRMGPGRASRVAPQSKDRDGRSQDPEGEAAQARGAARRAAGARSGPAR